MFPQWLISICSLELGCALGSGIVAGRMDEPQLYLGWILLYKPFHLTALESESRSVLSHVTMSHPTAPAVAAGTPAHHKERWRAGRPASGKKGQEQKQSCEALMGCSVLTLGPCPSQKPALGHNHRDPAGDRLLHSHERCLLHCDDSHRAPAVPGGGRGECPVWAGGCWGLWEALNELRYPLGKREIIV